MEKGSLYYYGGNYDYYREKKTRTLPQKTDTRAGKKSEKQRINRTALPKKTSGKYIYEMESLEASIAQLENKLKALNKDMEDNAESADKLLELYNQQSALKFELEKKYKRWEEVSEIVEQASSPFC